MAWTLVHQRTLTHGSACTLAVGPAIFAKTSARPGTRRTQPAEWRQWCPTCAYHPYADTRRHASRTAADMDDDGCDRPLADQHLDC